MLRNSFLGIMLLIITMQACKKSEDTDLLYPQGSNEAVNSWIMDSLQRYYYWQAQLPVHPDISLPPIAFFRSLLHKEDRFSRLYSPTAGSNQEIPVSSIYGFDYALLHIHGSPHLVGLIKQVLSDSPASRSGLQRGMYFTRVNAKPWTPSNSLSLHQELIDQRSVQLTPAERQGSTFIEQANISILAGYSFEQSPQQHIFELPSKRVAYLYLDHFIPGTAHSLVPIFAAFRSQGARELIVDLRYNAGGQVAEAAGLSALICGLPYGSPFIYYQGNKNARRSLESIGDAAGADNSLHYEELLQHSLGLKRVFILSSKATASAAEVVINNLKPYMEVVLIGETTMGKDMASFTIADQNKPKTIAWEINPLIYKLYNAQQQGDYQHGIAANIPVDEMQSLPLKPIADPDDPLIACALQLLRGSAKTPTQHSTSASAYTSRGINYLYYDSHIARAQHSRVLINKK